MSFPLIPSRDDRGVDAKGFQLKGQRLEVIVTGGIAAIETPRLIRELRRYGADVRVTMTPSATTFVSPKVFEWASAQPVLTDLSGAAEHITTADAVIIAPCTLDFLSRIALGLCDSAAATLVQSALATRAVLIAPAMHESLAQNPAYLRHREYLSRLKNIYFLDPVNAEGKSKMLDFESMAAICCHRLSRSPLRGRTALVTLGATRSAIDDVRYVSNFSTGALGREIADHLYREGVNVHVIAATTQINIPSYLPSVSAPTLDEMDQAIAGAIKKSKPEMGIFTAAVLDFEVSKAARGKRATENSFAIDLKPSRKLLAKYQNKFKQTVACKLETGLSDKELTTRVRGWSKSYPNVSIVIANLKEEVRSKSHHRALIFDLKDSTSQPAQSKVEIAQILSAKLS